MCDIDMSKLEDIKKEYWLALAKLSTKEDDIVWSADIDAVIVGTPDRFHANSMLKAAEFGKHAFVEKPLAANIEEFNKV